jgi:hypothetical protein
MSTLTALSATYLPTTSQTTVRTGSAAGRTAVQHGAPGLAAALERWLVRFVEMRERRAAIQVLRHLDDRIPHATGAYRDDLTARADDLRRALGRSEAFP